MSSTTMFMFCSTYIFIHSSYGYSMEQYDFYVSDLSRRYDGCVLLASCFAALLVNIY
jgi:hypothetical protein